MKSTIYIREYLPAMVSTRQALNSLRDNIKLDSKNEYVFDFTEIEFISRSFTDELLKFLKSTNANWQTKNTNDNIDNMIMAVQRSHDYSRSSYDHVAITHFKNKHDLNTLLASI